MSMFPDANTRRRVEIGYGTEDRAIFNFFNTVYAWMAVGLALTGVVAFAVSQSSAAMHMVYANRGIYAVLGIGAFLLAVSAQSVALRVGTAAGLAMFLLYAALIGALISGIFIIYPATTLAAAFVLTAGTFGAMSVYGFVTKRDLTSMGSILIMCVIGLFVASLVNLWIANSALSWLITYAVLLVFVGLTAYHTQQLKNFANEHAHNPEMASRMAVVGSLILYVAFINLFLSILRIMGNRR